MLKKEPACYTWLKNDYHIYLPLRGFIDLLLMVCKMYGDPCKIYFWTGTDPPAIQERIYHGSPFHLIKAHEHDFILPVAGNVTKPYLYWSSAVLVLMCSEEGKWTKIFLKSSSPVRAFRTWRDSYYMKDGNHMLPHFGGCKNTPYIGRAGK